MSGSMRQVRPGIEPTKQVTKRAKESGGRRRRASTSKPRLLLSAYGRCGCGMSTASLLMHASTEKVLVLSCCGPNQRQAADQAIGAPQHALQALPMLEISCEPCMQPTNHSATCHAHKLIYTHDTSTK